MPDFDGLNFIIDSAKPHKTAKLAAHAEDKNINLIIIPPRMTNLLQPADVCWFSEIKKAYHQKWVEWSINSIKEKSIHNNYKSPGYAVAIGWLSEIWENFPVHQLINSF